MPGNRTYVNISIMQRIRALRVHSKAQGRHVKNDQQAVERAVQKFCLFLMSGSLCTLAVSLTLAVVFLM